MTLSRPLFLIGNGCRGNPALVNSLDMLGVPVMTTWQGCDLIHESSEVFVGRPGTLGMRSSNIILQKCDWLMVIGARLDMEQVGHSLDNFAPNAKKSIFDIDEAELHKYPADWSVSVIDLSVNVPFVMGIDSLANPEWLEWCKNLYNQFRFELEGQDEGDVVNPYSFIRELSRICKEDDILVPGSSGQQSCAFMQAFRVKRGQRVLCCNTIGAMGMEPMAIGAAIATNKRVIVVTGDGGFAQNFQELEIVKRRNLPIHYFVFDNNGYGSIATMQDNHFKLKVGSDAGSGLTLPDLEKIARVWGFPFLEIHDNSELQKIKYTLDLPLATITRVRTSLDFRPACKVASRLVDGVMVSDVMENMYPYLPPEELARLMA